MCQYGIFTKLLYRYQLSQNRDSYRGAFMKDYESQYEEYKQTLLQNQRFIDNLRDKYRGTLTAEKDFVDENGVLGKVGILSGICGICLALFLLLQDTSGTASIIWRIVLFIIGTGSALWAVRIQAKFKKTLGRMVFYSFRYHKHFEDHIQEDKQWETVTFKEDLSRHIEFLQHCIHTMKDKHPEESEKDFMKALGLFEDLESKYEHIEKCNRYTNSLKNDYPFYTEIQKRIEQ